MSLPSGRHVFHASTSQRTRDVGSHVIQDPFGSSQHTQRSMTSMHAHLDLDETNIPLTADSSSSISRHSFTHTSLQQSQEQITAYQGLHEPQEKLTAYHLHHTKYQRLPEQQEPLHVYQRVELAKIGTSEAFASACNNLINPGPNQPRKGTHVYASMLTVNACDCL